MLLWLKILLLLWLVNFAPPLMAYLLDERWNRPLDQGVLFPDGRPFLGNHKTVRGVLAAIVAGALAGAALGFGWRDGLLVGTFSVLGDLLSSFIKRRIGLPSGGVVPGLDQGFEGFFPLLFLAPVYSLGWGEVLILLILFGTPAFFGSWFFKRLLPRPPSPTYPRKISPRVRLREMRACEISSNPLQRLFNFEEVLYYRYFMKTVFRVTGFYSKGVRNALRILPKHYILPFPHLPPEFEGYQILFLSDLHLDGMEGLTEALLSLLRPITVDLCILGGDFRMEMYGSCRETVLRTERLTDGIRSRDGIYAVLGNHDCIEIMQPLESKGVRFLVNESEVLERQGARIWLVGVDDPHYYRCHDPKQAFSGVPGGEFSICAVHSPEVYREAAAFGAGLYLCGHTHGGQIRAPFIGPVFTHSRAPRRFSYGMWRHGEMVGLTSSGVGASGLPVRFMTRGEVLFITLRRGRTEDAAQGGIEDFVPIPPDSIPGRL